MASYIASQDGFKITEKISTQLAAVRDKSLE
jgi:hypothetical protein